MSARSSRIKDRYWVLGPGTEYWVRRRRRPEVYGMGRINGVAVALVASVVIMLGWMFLSAAAALAVTLLAAGAVVVAARLKGKQDD